MSVNPSYGTLEDFKEFLDEAHERGLRVITELVLNHTSRSASVVPACAAGAAGFAGAGLLRLERHAETVPEARIIFKDFETSNWTWDPVAKAYFWHRFYSHQPDLNFDNPAVREDDVRGASISGWRWAWTACGSTRCRISIEREGTNCENLPETHDYPRASCARTSTRSSRTACCWRRPTSGRRMPSLISADRRRVPHEFPLPAHAAHVHGAADGGPLSDHRHPRADAGDSRRTASGRCSCATTTS